MRPKTSVFHVALHADVRTLTKAHEAQGKTSTRRETRPSLAEDNSKTSNTTLWCSWYRWTRFFIAQSMSMMSCQADHGARCCCHGKFIRTGMRIFVWKTVEGLMLLLFASTKFCDFEVPMILRVLTFPSFSTKTRVNSGQDRGAWSGRMREDQQRTKTMVDRSTPYLFSGGVANLNGAAGLPIFNCCWLV